MKRLQHIVLACAAIVLSSTLITGCDSGSSETDAQKFIGTWSMVSVTDDDGDKTSTFDMLGTLTLTLKDDNTHVLAIDLTDPMASDVNLPGNYSVNDGSKILLLGITLSGVPLNLPFKYDFRDGNTVELTVSNTIITQLLVELLGEIGNTLIKGDAVITLQRTT